MGRDAVEKLFLEYLSFRTVSSDPEAGPEHEKCASWLQSLLESFGASVEIWRSGGAPVVFASIAGKPGSPTLLIYNHYDVQPVDPISEWHTDPFTGKVAGDVVYARGAQDNKGQSLFVLLALHALQGTPPPCHIKLLIEGEEENGSASLAGLLQEKRSSLQSDYTMIIDVGMRKRTTPAITLGMRGMVALTVTCTGPSTDLHSGLYGGVVENPLHALVDTLASLRKSDGSIAVPGFYDSVTMPSQEELALFNLTADEDDCRQNTGQPFGGGEVAFSPTVRNWLRPTLEINGIHGGYGGQGSKTVIPREAIAKITCRLVPNQDPQRIATLLKNHILARVPRGVSIDVTIHEGMGRAVRSSPHTPGVTALAQAMEKVWGTKPEFILDGASIPIAPLLQKASGGELLAWGIGLPTDRIHAPNEHVDLSRLEKGFHTLCDTIAFLGALR